MGNNQFPKVLEGIYYVNHSYNLFNDNDIIPKQFEAKYFKFINFMTQFNKGIQLELYQKELENLENAIKESQTILDGKVHQYYSYFINNIKLLNYYKKEIQLLINEINLAEQIIKNSKMVNIDGNLEFTIVIVKSKLIINTVIKRFSMNAYAQLLIVLFIDKRFDETENNLILELILQNTIFNQKTFTDENITIINTRSYNYIKKNNFLKEEIKGVTYINNKLLPINKKMLKYDEFINKLIKSVNELIVLLPKSTSENKMIKNKQTFRK
jgi:hypothetical protein